jgi:hypothetical protein
MGEELDDGHLGAQHLVQARVHAQEHQRVAAEVEEVVIDANRVETKDRPPDGRELLLGGRARRHQRTIEHWPHVARHRQRPPVDFAGCRGGQAVERDEHRRNHIVGQAARERGPQGADRDTLVVAKHDIADQTLPLALTPCGLHGHRGFLHGADSIERSLDRC